MGIWRFAGAFAVARRQSALQISEANAGAPDSYRDAGMHSLPRQNGVSQPMTIGVCYVVVYFRLIVSMILFTVSSSDK